VLRRCIEEQLVGGEGFAVCEPDQRRCQPAERYRRRQGTSTERRGSRLMSIRKCSMMLSEQRPRSPRSSYRPPTRRHAVSARRPSPFRIFEELPGRGREREVSARIGAVSADHLHKRLQNPGPARKSSLIRKVAGRAYPASVASRNAGIGGRKPATDGDRITGLSLSLKRHSTGPPAVDERQRNCVRPAARHFATCFSSKIGRRVGRARWSRSPVFVAADLSSRRVKDD